MRLRYVNQFRDRHGKVRYYFRRAGFKNVPLPGLPGSAEFMDAYQAALVVAEPTAQKGLRHNKPGSFAALSLSYLNSAAFKAKRPETQRSERGIIDHLVAMHGDKLQAGLRQELHLHGLRHTMGDALADSEASPHEIAGLLGHKNVRSALHYSQEADRRKAGRRAMRKLIAGTRDEP